MSEWLPSRPFYRFGLALLQAGTDTGSVRDVLAELVPLTPGTRFRMRFPGGTVDPPVEGAERLAVVLAAYDRMFADYLEACGVRSEQVAECDVVATRGRVGLRYNVWVKDWRGWSLGVQIVFPPRSDPSNGG